MAANKKTIKKENIELCPGIVLDNSFFEQKEKRIYLMLLKGVMVYLVAMGSIGFYLSAFEIEYNALFCHIAIFIFAIISALLYYRLLIENLGYSILLVVFGYLVYSLKTVINSGFYAIVNITVDAASSYLKQDIQKLYTEQIDNRYLTVTMVVLFIGVVLDILLNVYISRRMQYVTAIFIVMGLNMIPLYLTEEPDNMYVIMFLAGIAMTYVFKSGKHYGPQVSNKRNDYVFEKKKKEIWYKTDIRALCQAGLTAFVFVLISVIGITAFKPKESFNRGYKTNSYKELTMAGVAAFMLEGWSAFYRNSDDVGGMHGGKLGDVASVKLDHSTDLVVTVTPHSYNTIYLKGFVGQIYNPYDNMWDEYVAQEEEAHIEASLLKASYDNEYEFASEGRMIIDNVAAGNRIYEPYYYYSHSDTDRKKKYEIVYYPRLAGNATNIISDDYPASAPYTSADLYVPSENYGAVMDFIDELGDGAKGEPEEIVRAVADYFQENIPYTISPGKTPKKKDFINYFLEDNKKGYCAHFASSSVLIFRALGIPARYVEGYALDYNRIVDEGELVDEDFDRYFSGYSELGKTAFVEVTITDAEAHAWVEIYEEGKGWYPVEVTPAGSEEEKESFWDMFDRMIGNGNQNGGNTFIGAGDLLLNARISNKTIKGIFYVLGGLIVFAFLVVITICLAFRLKKYIVFINASINDKLIIKYTNKTKKIRKHDKEFAMCNNYREQIMYLTPDSTDVIGIFERAGFSDKQISENEYKKAMDWLKTCSGKN